ncbi:hypothetical protein [Sphingomonas sp.]|uniref:hypothetical protein n=1 Tax=Sphingomonas sp. TaxID=28214 RepID=UPI003B3A6537
MTGKESGAAAGQRPVGRIAYLFGSDRQHGRAYAGGPGMLNEGSTDIRLLRSDPDDFVRIHIPVNFGRLKLRPALGGVATILNLITDADQNPQVLQWADRVLKPFSGRVLNRPAAVRASTRDAVYRSLSDLPGLIVPPVARFRGHPPLARAAVAQAGVRFPAILRVAGTHNGHILGTIPDVETLLTQIRPDTIYLLTEFVDRPAANGLYHKIRILFFGDVPVIRHRLVSDRWSVHGADRERVMPDRPEEMDRERTLLAGGMAALPPVAQATLWAIRARLPLDFFGIDFALLPDDRVLLFEANATMSFFPLSTHPLFAYAGAPVVATARAAMDRMMAGPDALLEVA